MQDKISKIDIKKLKAMTIGYTSLKLNLKSEAREKIEEKIAVEKPVNLFIDDEHITTILVTPDKLKEFAVGFLLDEGIVKERNQIKDLRIGDMDIKVKTIRREKMRIQAYRIARVITTECGSAEEFLRLLDRIEKPSVKKNMKLSAKKINNATKILSESALTYTMHGAAVFQKDGELISLAEDVGRHNAIDKAIGEAVLTNTDLTHCFLVITGRQSADMVLKAARVGIPIVASLAGPIFSGIYASEKTGLTLIGGARGSHLRIYTHPERII